ncbi:MAG: hypothetical protein WC654_02470 [Patescibacteria group bacterium]
MENIKLDDEYYISVLGAKNAARLKELEASAYTPEAQERVEALKRSFSPEARRARAERWEEARKRREEKNRGFPPGITFEDIEIA